MQNVYLKFYITEKQHYDGMPLYDWLLLQAKKIGVPGGSVYRAIAGYGRHGHLHEETFFELGGEMPVQVEFVLSELHADALINAARLPKADIFYVRYAVHSGIV